MNSNAINKITFQELKARKDWKQVVIVFSQDSFTKPYAEQARSYIVSSDDKYFNDKAHGNSLYGNCLDGENLGVRLDIYMHSISEDGLGERWIPEYCYIIE